MQYFKQYDRIEFSMIISFFFFSTIRLTRRASATVRELSESSELLESVDNRGLRMLVTVQIFLPSCWKLYKTWLFPSSQRPIDNRYAFHKTLIYGQCKSEPGLNGSQRSSFVISPFKFVAPLTISGKYGQTIIWGKLRFSCSSKCQNFQIPA